MDPVDHQPEQSKFDDGLPDAWLYTQDVELIVLTIC
jgi:hypothetical protein